MKSGEESNDYLESDAMIENRTPRPIRDSKSDVRIGRFGERLKEAINGESVRAFGRRAEVSEGALRQYMKGNRYPDLDILFAIAQTANVNLEWLATGEGPMRGERVGVSAPCAGHDAGVDVGMLAAALAAVELSRMDLPTERKVKLVAAIYALFAKEGRVLDAQAVRQVVDSLII